MFENILPKVSPCKRTELMYFSMVSSSCHFTLTGKANYAFYAVNDLAGVKILKLFIGASNSKNNSLKSKN